MSELASVYSPLETEEKWYTYWMENKMFRSVPDERKPYTVVIPPPNVTGVLHMGHMLNNTIQDVLVRKARMEGKNACWVPGTDHASIATEAKVVNQLKEKGISKHDLTREEFMKHAWEWTEKHGGIILEQLKKLGASCDWDRTRFTMEEDLSEAVIDVFIDLYKKGLIYRGVRMINWDPSALTALSDEEVVYKEVQSKLYYVKYDVPGFDAGIAIATTRPETILGDTAICVNPDDERFKDLIGKMAIVPLVEREIPIIADAYVDLEFGTGALKITPAHDINDNEIGMRHNLESIDVLNQDGTISEAAGMYIGQDRFVVRKTIANDLEATGQLIKVEELTNKVGFSERTDAVIEPRLSLQWFCKMSELSKPALDAVEEDEVKFYPDKFKNSYRHWMENVKDWCVSRQLWWGQRIPAFYYGDGPNDFAVGKTPEEALSEAKRKSGNESLTVKDLRQDDDVVDTWFSSWLWPISVFDGFKSPDNDDIKYYYPTNDLVTAPEIMFFWVARMIMAGYEYKGEKPFKNVYYTGIVRDAQRRKMSKSLGNSPDPIKLMKKYGADGVRVGMLLSSPAGNDLLFDEQLCEQGRNFTNKLWNAFRLIKSWDVDEKQEQPEVSKIAKNWFKARFQQRLSLIMDNYEKFRISDVLMLTYKLVWDDFCSWYLEMIKPSYGAKADTQTVQEAMSFLEDLLKVLHPFTPFITEEIWHSLKSRAEKECVMVAQWPEKESFDVQVVFDFEYVQEVIAGVRNFRKEKNIPQKQAIDLKVMENKPTNHSFDVVIQKLTNLNGIEIVSDKPENAFSFRIGANEFFIPIDADLVDIEGELNKLKEELTYTEGFLKSVMKKLSNERFVNNAPDQVVAKEKAKQTDAEQKITVLKERIESLSKA